eukprot:6189923-Pleurochrysis_carterae.AAC.4
MRTSRAQAQKDRYWDSVGTSVSVSTKAAVQRQGGHRHNLGVQPECVAVIAQPSSARSRLVAPSPSARRAA